MSPSTILILLALVAFVLAAAGWSYKKTDLIAIGLAFWSLSQLLDKIAHLNLSALILIVAFIAFVGAAIGWRYRKLILIVAFIAFVAAAIGWRYRKLNLIAVGLALWMLSLVVTAVVR